MQNTDKPIVTKANSLQIEFKECIPVDEDLIRQTLVPHNDCLSHKKASEKSVDGSFSGSRFLDFEEDETICTYAPETCEPIGQIISEAKKLLVIGDYDSAIQKYGKAIIILNDAKGDVRPLLRICKLGIATCYSMTHNYKEAKTTAHEILECYPDCIEAKQLLSTLE